MLDLVIFNAKVYDLEILNFKGYATQTEALLNANFDKNYSRIK